MKFGEVYRDSQGLTVMFVVTTEHTVHVSEDLDVHPGLDIGVTIDRGSVMSLSYWPLYGTCYMTPGFASRSDHLDDE